MDLEVCGIGFGSFFFFSLFCIHSSIRYVFHMSYLKELDIYSLLTRPIWSEILSFSVIIHLSTVTRDSSALRCESRLYPAEKDKVENSLIIDIHSSSFLTLCLDLN